jgi:hypothetical protein
MASGYRIEITPNELGADSVAFTLDASVSPFRLTEVSVQIGSDGSPLPIELGEIDFRAYVSIAVALSAGVFPSRGQAPMAGSGPPSDETYESRPSASQVPTVTASTVRRLGRKTDVPRTGAPSDLAVYYWRLGSVAKVAKHYDVPRQVARDWIKELRNRNSIPNPWS